MDPIFTILITLTSLIFVTHFIIKWTWKSRSPSVYCLPLPPGKMGLPIFGESIEFVRGLLKGHPESFVLDRIRRYSSETFKTHLMGGPVAVMYGTAATKFLFANEGKLVKVSRRKAIERLILSNEEEERIFKVREITHTLLTSDGLQKRVGDMDRIAKIHLESKWIGCQQVKAYQLVEDFIFSLICQQFLSITDELTIESLAIPMAALRRGLFSFWPINLPWTDFGKAMRASRLIKKRMGVIIRKRRAELKTQSSSSSPDDLDFLSLLVLATNDHGEHLNDDVIANQLIGFLIAGHTASIVITAVISLLADHPDIYYKVLQEQLDVAARKEPGDLLNLEDTRKMSYSWNVICEAMRLYPPALLIHKETMDDVVYDGFCIPKGWKIQLNIVSTHKDPKFFPEPDKFNPSRFEGEGVHPYTFVPFGGGRRMCPGNKYAKLQILVLIHNIIMRFRWDKVHANEEIIFSPIPKPSLGLIIHLHPRSF